jgi:predicted dehydrogenase
LVRRIGFVLVASVHSTQDSIKESNMGVIRVGVVGCGRIADLHELGYRERDDAVISAVCDTNRRRARRRAKAWGIEKIYTDYQDLLSDHEIDLVELLVPHHLHAPMTVAACKAGKHVSVQKPMALSVGEADRMIEAADSADVVLRVFENFVFYEPHVRAKEMIDTGAIGEPQMIRVHVGTGKSKTEWKVPLNAWLWRVNEEKCGGGPLIFDHGYHLFSLVRFLMGDVERVYAWMDKSPVGGLVPRQVAQVDAPATIMFQFKSPRRYGVLDFVHTPEMVMDSIYYADDDRVEVIGEKGIILINRCTARTLDLPPLMLFRDGKTREIPVERVEWHDSFIACTQHLIDVLKHGGDPMLDGRSGRAVLQFTLAAHISASEGCEVRPDDVT